MIKSFHVAGLHGKYDYDLIFNDDINILTGKNGSGKTTLLKLIWYMLSPNIERTVPEINFREAKIVTSKFSLDIIRNNSKRRESVKINYQEGRKKPITYDVWADEFHDPLAVEKVEQVNRQIYQLKSSSVFFPTFRRIEGGFSLEQDHRRHPISVQMAADLSQAISTYSGRMSAGNHRFIASISTEDIEALLTKKYALLSDQTNQLHTDLSSYITNTISSKADHKEILSEKQQLMRAKRDIDDIRKKVISIEQKREKIMRPFTVLSNVISEIYKNKGISFSQNLVLGFAKDAINAKTLSAGEKQMLSFLCYNAFHSKNPIFIDEPELSLHVDWQRILFNTLISQGTNNQFIVSTHSPFIYTRYPEKEINLDIDRGYN